MGETTMVIADTSEEAEPAANMDAADYFARFLPAQAHLREIIRRLRLACRSRDRLLWQRFTVRHDQRALTHHLLCRERLGQVLHIRLLRF